MKTNRKLQFVSGEPSKAASRAALRLAARGDQLEVLSPTEFIWRPQPAERKLFRCPKSVRVSVEPSDRSGYAAVIMEWRGDLGHGWLKWFGGVLAAIGVGAAFAAPGGWPLWKLAAGAVPAIMALLAPKLMESDWLSRLTGAVELGPTQIFSLVPEADSWLSCDEDRRQELLDEVERKAAELPAGPLGKGAFAPHNRRSAVEILGWPLWHVAFGRDPLTDRAYRARGWYARGQFATGLMAVGQVSHGWFALGQAAYGLIAIGQAALGIVYSIGQLGIAALFGLAQLGAALVGVGQLMWSLFFVGQVGTDAIGKLLAGLLSGIAVGIGVAVPLLAKYLLNSTEQRELGAQLEARHRQAQPVADDGSISLAERLTGDVDPDRGVSLVDDSADA